MQNEIVTRSDLLDKKGNLIQKGWARSALLKYNRNQVTAMNFQIKEWDYYAVLNDEFGISLTVADNGYFGVAIVTMYDFTIAKEWTKQVLLPFPLGKFNMPESSSAGNITFKKNDFLLKFTKDGDTRKLHANIKDFYENKDLQADIELKEFNRDSLMIATPFHKEKRFYYNHKINNLEAKGLVKFAEITFDFTTPPSDGLLDWGRGVWTYNNTWYWSSASGTLEGVPFGFNIGYGFGDTSHASENILFYNGIGHKLDQVTFHIPDNYTDQWAFTSNDGRFELTFEPVIDRNSKTKVLMIQSDQHQVFGHFTGKVILDDGTPLIVEQVFGFAEEVMNKW